MAKKKEIRFNKEEFKALIRERMTREIGSPWGEEDGVLIRKFPYHLIGRIVAMNFRWCLMRDAAWLADTGATEGRFGKFLSSGPVSSSEIENFPAGTNGIVAIMVGSEEISPWVHDLPIEGFAEEMEEANEKAEFDADAFLDKAKTQMQANEIASPWSDGDAVLVRRFPYHLIGRIFAQNFRWMAFEDSAWLADTGGTNGRFGRFLSLGPVKSSEIENFPEITGGMSSIVIGSEEISPWIHDLPIKIKE